MANMLNRWRRQPWLRALERGDGDTYAYILHSVYLWALLLAGIIFAMVGFWRVSASYANLQGARVGAIATNGTGSSQNQNVQNALFAGITGARINGGPIGTFNRSSGDRCVAVANAAVSDIWYSPLLGDAAFKFKNQTYTRIERFFGGRPLATGVCSE